MKYTKFNNLEISQLGFGMMRLPTIKENGPIDEEPAIKLIRYAYENGVNYFDTAFFYHEGESEHIVGKALAVFPRDTWHLADKMPGNFMEVVDGKLKVEMGMNAGAMIFDSPADVFEFQLKKCGVDYFDFYLLHNVAEDTMDIYTDERLGIIEYLLEEKKAGRIKHFGFSTHAGYECLEKFLNEYDCFEFAQLQHNYLDATIQEGTRKYNLLTKHGLPVIIMEPVRGGKLANPGAKEIAILKAARPHATPASWAFRYLQSLQNAPVILSGMSKIEQVKENIEIFSDHDPMTDADLAVLNQVVESMGDFIPCTSCRYCTSACPRSLDIPILLTTYNEAAVEFSWIAKDLVERLSDDELPGACVNCGACLPLCPQNIDIPEVLSKFEKLIQANKPTE
ncbi:MAG: aldo/keto reductase [Oscillospiraceae bacterium]|nr:aldo/keto reductase [Oscillospiraceae bacterium]